MLQYLPNRLSQEGSGRALLSGAAEDGLVFLEMRCVSEALWGVRIPQSVRFTTSLRSRNRELVDEALNIKAAVRKARPGEWASVKLSDGGIPLCLDEYDDARCYECFKV
jgi:hypothetical protein